MVNLALGVLVQFLDCRGDPGQEHYALFHQSLRDYLGDPVRNRRFACPPEDGHRAIAEYYLEGAARDWSKCDDYGLKHLPAHLSAAGLAAELHTLLFDYRWLQAKLDRLGINALLADFSLDQNAADDAIWRLGRALKLASYVLAEDKRQLAGQLIGRLMDDEGLKIGELLMQARERQTGTWLCPVTATLATPGGALLSTRRGKTDGVKEVAITPDGSKAVSYESHQHTLTVWDLKGSQPPRVMAGHSDSIEALALTPDCRWAVTAARDKTLKVWDLEQARVICALRGHGHWVLDLALTDDGKTAISSGGDNTIRLWDLTTGTKQRTIYDTEYRGTKLAVTPDARWALTATKWNSLRLWNLRSEEDPIEFGRNEVDPFLFDLGLHRNDIWAIALTPDGRKAISASDKTMQVWDVDSRNQLWELAVLSRHSTQLKVASDGSRFASFSGTWSSRLTVWDTATGSILRVIPESPDETVGKFAVTPDLRTVIGIRSDDRALLVWDLEGGTEECIVGWHPDMVLATALAADGRMAVTICGDDALRVWDLDATRPSRPALGHENHGVTAVAVTPDGARAVSGAFDGSLKVWEVEAGRELFSLTGRRRAIRALAFTPTGKEVITGSDGDGLLAFNLENGEALDSITVKGQWVDAIAVTPDKRWVLFQSSSKLKIWDLEANKERRTLPDAELLIDGFALVADGQHAVLALQDDMLGIWNIESGEAMRSWTGCPRVMSLAITPDEHWIVTIGSDQTTMVWDATSRMPARTVDEKAYWASPAAVTPDSRYALTVSGDHILRVWDLMSGAEVYQRHAHTDEIRSIVVTADSRRVVTASRDHTVKVWDLKSGEVLAVFAGEAAMSCCAVSLDGGMIVAGDDGGQVHLLRLYG